MWSPYLKADINVTHKRRGLIHADKLSITVVIVNSISTALTKAKSRESAYSRALNQNKLIESRSRSREAGIQTVRRLWWMVFGVQRGSKVWGRGWIKVYDLLKSSVFSFEWKSYGKVQERYGKLARGEFWLSMILYEWGKCKSKNRALPILVFANIADTDIADIFLASMSTDIADTDIFGSIIISTQKYWYRYIIDAIWLSVSR